MKDYKKILKGVVNIIATTEKTDIGFANICSYLSDNCDELFESDDERIRKEIVRFIQMEVEDEIVGDKWIAWLKKQESVEEIVERCKDSWYNEGKIQGQIEGLSDEEKYQQGWHDALEKQVPVDKDKVVKGVKRGVATSLINYIDANSKGMCLSNMECEDIEDAIVNGKWYKVYNYMKKKLEKQGDKPQGKSALEAWKEKKVDNSNKVEQKFKVGDWIVEPRKGEHNCIWHIERIEKNSYWEGHVGVFIEHADKYYHLWTIADAKDGDVLVASDGSIFLFAGVVDCACKYYVALTTDNYVKINKEKKGGYWETSRAVYPATREQRDKLEKAMADAGYEWDAEKKELKLLITNGGDFEQENCEQNPAWSESDEEEFQIAIDTLVEAGQRDSAHWLESIKDRYTWKPSNIQMECLYDAINHYHINGYPASKLSELYEQMSKIYKL